MNKEMTLENNDEVVDLGRRSMMARFGLAASIACAAPVLMTMSTSALAKHKNKGTGKGRGKGQGRGAERGQGNGAYNGTGTSTGEGGGEGGGEDRGDF